MPVPGTKDTSIKSHVPSPDTVTHSTSPLSLTKDLIWIEAFSSETLDDLSALPDSPLILLLACGKIFKIKEISKIIDKFIKKISLAST